MLALPSAAAAAPALNGSFDVSGSPQRLALGPDGNVWFTLADSTTQKEFGRIKPSGAVDEFDTPGGENPIGITEGPDGNLWMTAVGKVIRVSPASPATGTAFPITDLIQAQTIVKGPDGNLWTGSADKIFKIATTGSEISHYTVSGLAARGIAAGGDGNLWVADFAGKRVIRAPTTGSGDPTTKFDATGGTQEVTNGPSGQLGFTQPTDPPQYIGRIGYAGTIQKTTLPTGTDPFGIVFGNDGAYWVAEFGVNAVGRLTTSGAHTQIKLPAGSGPRYLAKGRSDTLWVGLQTTHKIARITGVSAPAGQQPVVPPGIQPDTAAPGVTGYSLASRVMRPFPRGGSIARATRGTRVRYTLTETATAKFTVQRLVKGRKIRAKGKTRCVRRTRKNAQRRKCTRRVRVGAFPRPSSAGANAFRFTARVKGHALRPGRYRMLLVATDAAGNASKPLAVRFRVVKRRART